MPKPPRVDNIVAGAQQGALRPYEMDVDPIAIAGDGVFRCKVYGAATVENPPRRMVHRVGKALAEAREAQADSGAQNLRFHGRYFDEESGRHYNRFRYGDPGVGLDHIGPQGSGALDSGLRADHLPAAVHMREKRPYG